MARNIVVIILCACIFITFIADSVSAEKQKFEEISQVYICEYPPFMFTKDGKVTGVSTEIVREIMKRLQVSYDIKSLPWKRAYSYLLEEPVMAVMCTRTAARENLLKWAGPLIAAPLVFFAKRDSKIEIKNLEDAKKVESIGLVEGYSVERHLVQNGSAAKTYGGTKWINSSDERLKDITGEYQQGLEAITRLRPVTFFYKQSNPRGLPSNEENIGFIAQEVQEVFPEAVSEGSDGYLDFNMHPVNVALVNAVRELKAENDALRQEIQQIKAALGM